MKILIGAPVRQKPEIFKAYLRGLRGLLIPEGIKVDRIFILHNSPELRPDLDRDDIVWEHMSEEDFRIDNDTHRWMPDNIVQVTSMKNMLLRYAFAHGYDYFFLVDSDLVLHPKTLEQLLSCSKDIIANVFWTAWRKGMQEGPNAWDFDNYTFLPDSLEKWRSPGCYRVGMSGACILISRRVIEAGVNYSRIPNLSYNIFWGEDRHFCIKAACLGFDIWLETTYPATHIYRESDLGVASYTGRM